MDYLKGFLKESIEAGKERFEGFPRRVQMPSRNECIQVLLLRSVFWRLTPSPNVHPGLNSLVQLFINCLTKEASYTNLTRLNAFYKVINGMPSNCYSSYSWNSLVNFMLAAIMSDFVKLKGTIQLSIWMRCAFS